MGPSLGPPPPDRRVVWSLRGGHPGGLRVLWGPEGLALRGPWLRHGRAPPPATTTKSHTTLTTINAIIPCLHSLLYCLWLFFFISPTRG